MNNFNPRCKIVILVRLMIFIFTLWLIIPVCALGLFFVLGSPTGVKNIVGIAIGILSFPIFVIPAFWTTLPVFVLFSLVEKRFLSLKENIIMGMTLPWLIYVFQFIGLLIPSQSKAFDASDTMLILGNVFFILVVGGLGGALYHGTEKAVLWFLGKLLSQNKFKGLKSLFFL